MLKDDVSLSKHISWIKKSVAFSRLFVDTHSLKTEITAESKFQLANLYAVHYWLPMRSHTPVKVELPDNVPQTYTINKYLTKSKQKVIPTKSNGQLSLFSEGDANDDD